MRFPSCKALVLMLTAAVFTLPATAEIVYTPVNVSIPVNGSYQIDLDGVGIADFTLQSKLLQEYCQNGDEFTWILGITSASGNAVVTDAGHIGVGVVAAMQRSAPVNPGASFSPSASLMAELYWGACGTGAAGEWLGLPDRYLGFQFKGSDNAVHYAWAKLSTVAYVDNNGHLHATTILSGFAYETVAGQGIYTGQTSDIDRISSALKSQPTEKSTAYLGSSANHPQITHSALFDERVRGTLSAIGNAPAITALRFHTREETICNA
jgi:hypothetical protein